MNRSGVAQQTMRGMPGFGGQQQPQQQQQGRSASSRLPNGKLGASNGSGWAFGTGSMPMGGSGNMQNPSRQMGGNVSFAQSLSGSQSSTPLDPSEFPSLSNNSQPGGGNAPSMWSTAAAAGNRGPGPRSQAAAAQAQEDLYNSSSSPAGFRFGGQGQAAQAPSNPPEEFPPLNRNGNGEVGGERGSTMSSQLGFGAQGGPSASGPPASRTAGNGLLNALSANNRASDAQSSATPNPPGMRRSTDRAADSTSAEAAGPSSPGQGEASNGKGKEPANGPTDPLAGMSEADKWGMKGLSVLMNNYPAYAATAQGMDPAELGLNLNSPELISTQIWSPFNDTPPRPALPSHRTPECYKVTNVQPIASKMQSFNEETLFWIFYNNVGDQTQYQAASELHNARNWRWHRREKFWLTKDEQMTPQNITPNQEQGYYIVWDTDTWSKVRRQMVLYYEDLETSLANR